MKNTVLKIEHLSKTFGKREILHDISFETYEGEIFGFLGPNGAGKTTTIKIAAGLLRLDEGEIYIAGHSVKKNFEDAMACVGGIVENPEFYKYMSGLDNLRLFANIRDGVTEERIKEVVHLVGLDNRIKDKVGKYSLGMRQRLGVAQAILHRPKLLILDEPTNGLDPAGIKELRDILKEISHNEGVSVLVSSHLMSEMEMMCDRVGVIVNGVLVDVKPIDELVSATSLDKQDYEIRVDDPARAIEVLDFVEPKNKLINGEGNLEVIVTADGKDEAISHINKAIVDAGLKLYTVSPKQNRRLEDVFIELTKAEGGDQIA